MIRPERRREGRRAPRCLPGAPPSRTPVAAPECVAEAKKPRIYAMSFASVYPLYVQKAERKGRSKREVDEVIRWLTGYDQKQLDAHLKKETDFESFLAEARLNPARSLIKGVVCGVRVEDIQDPTMQGIRYLDKLVDELAKGKAMDAILRKA